jgi:hypothetical protein
MSDAALAPSAEGMPIQPKDIEASNALCSNSTPTLADQLVGCIAEKDVEFIRHAQAYIPRLNAQYKTLCIRSITEIKTMQNIIASQSAELAAVKTENENLKKIVERRR